MFFNTIKLFGEELNAAQGKAVIQKEAIKVLFTKQHRMTPSEVWKLYQRYYTKAPITSIRRAMSVLKTEGYLLKTTELKNGIYGTKEHIFQVVSQTA